MPYSDPNKQREYQREWQRKRAIAIKELLAQFKNQGCMFCSESADDKLDFHHVFPETKKFGLGTSGGERSKKFKKLRNDVDLLIEASKCIVVCKDCHKDIHARVRTLSTDLLNLYEQRMTTLGYTVNRDNMYFVANPNRKFTAEEVREIRASYDTHKNLGNKYGISKSMITRIRSREMYSDIT